MLAKDFQKVILALAMRGAQNKEQEEWLKKEEAECLGVKRSTNTL